MNKEDIIEIEAPNGINVFISFRPGTDPYFDTLKGFEQIKMLSNEKNKMDEQDLYIARFLKEKSVKCMLYNLASFFREAEVELIDILSKKNEVAGNKNIVRQDSKPIEYPLPVEAKRQFDFIMKSYSYSRMVLNNKDDWEEGLERNLNKLNRLIREYVTTHNYH